MSPSTSFVDLLISLDPFSTPSQSANTTVRTYRLDLSLRSPVSAAKRSPPARNPMLVTIDENSIAQYSDFPMQYGHYLCERLFENPGAKTLFAEARTASEEHDVPLRIRLDIGQGAPELHALRWETLRDPESDAFLFANENVLFTRFLESMDRRVVTISSHDDLRALVVIANPKAREGEHLDPVDVNGEKKRAEESLSDIPATVLCTGVPGAAPTFSNLMAQLRKDCHILYLICHGKIIDNVAKIWLEAEDGYPDVISTEEARAPGAKRRPGLVAELCQLSRTPRLIVLSACQSAGDGKQWASEDIGVITALGPRLVEDAGVPVVVAMQGNVTMKTIDQFMPVFFQELRRDGQIDRAMAVARAEVLRSGQSDWWMPVLFTRLEDGRLFGSRATRLREFIQEHSRVFMLIALLAILQAGLFLFVRDRYLVGLRGNFEPMLAGLTLSLGGAVWAWSRLLPRWPQSLKRVYLSAGAIGLSLAWLWLGASQVQPILNPIRFEQNTFGIAIATFGQGSNWWTTQNGYEGADILYRALNEEIHRSGNDDLPKMVPIQRIGLIDAEGSRAGKIGEQIGASLVIWGHLVQRGTLVDIAFHILQAPDLLDNPSLPQAIPLQEMQLQTSVTLPYSDFASAAGRELASHKSLGIATFSLGLARYYSQEYGEAIIQFNRAVEKLDNPSQCQTDGAVSSTQPQQDLGLLYYFLGKSYQYLGRFEDSLVALDKALCYNAADMAAWLGQSYNYRVIGDDPRRQAALHRVIDLSRLQPSEFKKQAMYNRALAYVSLKNDEDALRTYTAIYEEEDPSFFIAYLGAAEVLTRLNRFDEAQQVYEAAAALTEDNVTREVGLEVEKGQLYEAWEKPDLAEAAYLKAIKLDATVVTPQFLLAELYARAGQSEAAETLYRQVIELSEVPAWSYAVYARFLASTGDYAGAIDQYKNALDQLIYNDADLHTYLGLAYAEVDESLVPDKEARALEQFELALRNPGSSEAWIRHEYGRTLYKFGHRTEAIVQLEQSLKIDKGFGSVTRWNLGQIYEYMHQPERAIAMYISLIEGCEQMAEELGTDVAIDRLRDVQSHLNALGAAVPACRLLPQG